MSFLNRIREYADQLNEEESWENVPSQNNQQAIVQIPKTQNRTQERYTNANVNDMFDIIKYTFRPKIMRERMVLTGFAAIASVCLIFPIINPKQDSPSKTIEMVLALASGLCLSAGLYSRTKEEKNYAAVDNASHELLKQVLTHELNYEQTGIEVSSKKRIKEFLLRECLPEELGYWMNYYELHGLMQPPVQQTAVVETPKKQTQSLASHQSSFGEMADKFGNQVDYSWLNEEEIYASKAVIGEKGTGKSLFLSYLASLFLSICPDGELRIVDPHFDDDEYGKWLPGLPLEYLKKHYVTKHGGVAVFKAAGKLLRERITDGIKLYKLVDGVKIPNPACTRFHLICDEFDAFFPSLSEIEKNEVSLVLQQVQYEGRKYGVDITLGMHTMKKLITGLDSSILHQMDLIILGRILADINNPVPVDFDRKVLLANQEMVQRSLKQNQGRACTFRKLNEPPMTAVIPFIDLSQSLFSIDVEEQEEVHETVPQEKIQTAPSPSQSQNSNQGDWLAQMKTWLKSLDNLPTPEQVRQKYQSVVMKEINDDQLRVLMNYLEILPEPEEE